MERLPDSGVESTKEGGGPPDWKLFWKRTGDNSIEIIYGDVIFPYNLRGGRVNYKKRRDFQRVSRHLTDSEYNEVRRQAEAIFDHFWKEASLEKASEARSETPPKEKPEQFELNF